MSKTSKKQGGSLAMLAGELKGVLKRAGSVIRRASTLPVLSTVRLGCEPGGWQVEATDLDRAWRERLRTERDGGTAGDAVCVAHGMLSRLVGGFDNDAVLDLVLDEASGVLTLKGNGREARLMTLPADEFPRDLMGRLPESGSLVPVPAGVLKKGLDSVRGVASTDPTRYVLNGVHFAIGQGRAAGGVELVATDGRRMSAYVAPEVAAAVIGTERPGLTVPSAAVESLLGMLAEVEDDGEIRLGFSADGYLSAVAPGERCLVAKLIEGNYPQWRNVVPVDGPQDVILKVDREKLLAAVRWMAAFGKGGPGSVGTKLGMSASGVVLERQCPEMGHGEAKVEAEWTGKEAMTVCVDVDYLAAAIAAADVERLELKLIGAMSPVKIESGSLLQILMPMRVND